MIKKMMCLCAVLGLLVGCTTSNRPVPPPNGDPAQVKLTEAAAATTQSLEELAAIKKAQMPNFDKALTAPDAFGMGDEVTVNWTGPIGPLVKHITLAAHYRLRVLGSPPAIPIIINIDKRSKTLGEILRNADFQAARRADVVVYEKTRTVELRYHDPSDVIASDSITSSAVADTSQTDFSDSK